MKTEGLIQIYTGDGKGKTTSAVGLACRALGHDLKVCLIHFHKNPDKREYGEWPVLRELGADVFGFANKHPHFYKNVDPDDVRADCLKGLEFINELYREKEYDLLILDEINISLRDGFLKEEEVLDILNSKPEKLELVLTGRFALGSIVEKADIVSEIRKIKHPYNSGIKSREGIEY